MSACSCDYVGRVSVDDTKGEEEMTKKVICRNVAESIDRLVELIDNQSLISRVVPQAVTWDSYYHTRIPSYIVAANEFKRWLELKGIRYKIQLSTFDCISFKFNDDLYVDVYGGDRCWATMESESLEYRREWSWTFEDVKRQLLCKLGVSDIS